ncbi:hypothetical protein B484DRAFT_18530, partial [Ochromonadaceae sp. CCMP2298]
MSYTFDMNDLDLDLAEFLEYDAVEESYRRFASDVASASATVWRAEAPLLLRECKLFMCVRCVEGLPVSGGCGLGLGMGLGRGLGVRGGRFSCEIEVLKTKHSTKLAPQAEAPPSTHTKHTPRGGDSGDRAWDCWDLAEYFGQTKVTLKIKKTTALKRVLVGTRTIALSDLVALAQTQGQTQAQEQTRTKGQSTADSAAGTRQGLGLGQGQSSWSSTLMLWVPTSLGDKSGEGVTGIGG